VSAPRADPEALAQALSGVDQRVEPTSWGEYVAALSEALRDWLQARVEALELPFPPGTGTAIAWTIVALLAVSLALLIARGVAGWRQRRGAAGTASTEVAIEVPEVQRPRGDWAAEAQARLARGDVRGALEAAWWWLATALSATVDPTATTRELVTGAGRSDLVPLARRMDALTYGAAPPTVADVRDLLKRVEGAVPT
jgi:hypothetical protein